MPIALPTTVDDPKVQECLDALAARTPQRGQLVLRERKEPPSAIENAVVLYTQDNGAGKTKLMGRFGTEEPVQIAIEP